MLSVQAHIVLTTDRTDYTDVRLGSARGLACWFRRPRRNDLSFDHPLRPPVAPDYGAPGECTWMA